MVLRGVILAILVILLVAAPRPASAQDESLDGLLARIQSAHGGEALPQLGDIVRTEGENFSVRRGVIGSIMREVSWPDKLRTEIRYDDGTAESRRLDGTRGWRDGQPASAPFIAAMRLQAARLSLPMILSWERASLRDMGEATREDGKRVHRISLPLDERLTLFVEIDPATGWILRSAGVMHLGDSEMDFGAIYPTRKRFGGMVLPDYEVQTAVGQIIGWTVIDKIEVVPKDRRD